MQRENNHVDTVCKKGKMTRPVMERGMITILNNGTNAMFTRIATHETMPKRYMVMGKVKAATTIGKAMS
jgi:DUF917 family protein